MLRGVELIYVVLQYFLFVEGVHVDDQRVGRAVDISRSVEESATQRNNSK